MYSIIVELSTVHNGKSQGDTEWYLLPQHYYIYASILTWIHVGKFTSF